MIGLIFGETHFPIQILKKVKKIMDYGAFVNILPGKDGLVHISQIKQEIVNNVRDEMSEGDEVQVKVLDIDGQGRVKLTMKDID